MLYTKDGYPEVNEIVKCTVKRISGGNTVFVSLDEYENNLEAVLTISEIAPGRIRNLRDHVIENKVIVCKVLRVDPSQKRVDVSLRRVPIPVMKDKLEQLKKEEYAEKIYLDVAKELSISKDDLFEKTYEIIFEEYDTVYDALYEIMLDNDKISMFKNLNDSERNLFLEGINDKIKPENVTLKNKFLLKSFEIDGNNLIKKVISLTLDDIKHDKIKINYASAESYIVIITHDDIKSASRVMDLFFKSLEKYSKENNVILNFKN